MPDSSLRVKLCFFFHYHSDSVRRSRMTAEVNCVSSKFSLGFCKKWQNGNRKPSPLVGEGVNRQVDGRGKLEQKRKNGKTNGQSAGGWKGISFMQNNISVFMVK